MRSEVKWGHIMAEIRSDKRSDIGSETSSSSRLDAGVDGAAQAVAGPLAADGVAFFPSLKSKLCERSPLICMKAGERRRAATWPLAPLCIAVSGRYANERTCVTRTRLPASRFQEGQCNSQVMAVTPG